MTNDTQLQRIIDLEAENKRLREALSFYADPRSYQSSPDGEAVLYDRGQRLSPH